MGCAMQVTDSEGRDLGNTGAGRGGGYRYFGAAKTLPGVRELFEKEPPKKARSILGSLLQHFLRTGMNEVPTGPCNKYFF